MPLGGVGQPPPRVPRSPTVQGGNFHRVPWRRAGRPLLLVTLWGGGEIHTWSSKHALGACRHLDEHCCGVQLSAPKPYPPCWPGGVCAAAASFLRGSRAVIQVLQGDLNASVRHHGGGWLSKVLQSGAWLLFLLCPCDDRSPFNFVPMRRVGAGWHISETLSDWFSLAAGFTPLSCPQQQLPRLSTHVAQLVSMVFSPEHVRPRHPVRRMFDLRRLFDS